MTPEEILHAALIADPAVSGYVGIKVFADIIEQDTERPVIVYQRTATEPKLTIHGTQYGSIVHIAVIVHAAERREEADAIASAVNAALTAASFWQTTQSGGFEPEISATSVEARYAFFDTS